MTRLILLVSGGAMAAGAALSAGPEGVCTPARVQFTGHAIMTGPMPGRPVLADMNRDGLLDIVVACGTCCGSPASPASGHVLVLLNDGRGTFQESTAERLKIGPSVRKVGVADVDSDGAPDVLAAEHDSYTVTVLLNDGNGVLRRHSTLEAASGRKARPHTHDIIAADVDGDGHADAVTTNANDNSVSVLLGDGRAGFAPAGGSPFAAGRHPYDALGAGDFNGDGRVDLMVPLLQERAVGLLAGDASGSMVRSGAVTVDERPGCVAVGDVNADGRLDVVATHDDEGIVDVLLGDGKGGFDKAAGSPFRVSVPVWGVVLADMNADKTLDLAMGVANGAKVCVALGRGDGSFDTAGAAFAEADRLPMYVAVGDLNGDAKPDVVASNYGAGTLTVLLAK